MKFTLPPTKITAGNTKIIPDATDSPPLDINCNKFLPKIVLGFTNRATSPDPIIAPGIPAATVNPAFIPE